MYVTRTYQQLQFNSIIKIVKYFGYIFNETEKDLIIVTDIFLITIKLHINSHSSGRIKGYL